jgi:DNA-binding response OmpR family regulator
VTWKLLIVEDDPDISTSLCDVFTMRGYDVACASNGKQALDRVRHSGLSPDVVLLDLLMPVMDGLEFLAVSREEPLLVHVPIIVMTAQPTLLDGIEEVAFDRLTKPAGLATIVAAVERACHGHKRS